MKKTSTFSLLILLIFWMACCKPDGPDSPDVPDKPDTPDNPTDTLNTDTLVIDSTAVSIFYTDTGIVITNPLENEILVQQSNGHISVRSQAAGMKFVLSGAHPDASFSIASDSSFSLILDSLNLTSLVGPAIYIQSRERTLVYLNDSTENFLNDAITYSSENDADTRACLYAKGGLIFGGKGKLTIQSKSKHALCSDRFIRIQEGEIMVETAARDGIHVSDYFVMDQGRLHINSLSDGIECDAGFIRINGGELMIHSEDEGIITSYLGPDTAIKAGIVIEQGSITVTTTDEKSMGIDAAGDLVVYGGTLIVELEGNASKALRSKGNMFLLGGCFDLTTKGNAAWDEKDADFSSAAGIKCDGNLQIAGAETSINILSTGKGGKGINTEGQILIEEGSIQVKTTGVRDVYGTYSSNAKGIKCDADLTISGGKIKVESTGSSGSDGIDSDGSLSIDGGEIEVLAYDDCIKSLRNMTLNNGNIYCYSTHNDALDTKASLTVNGGFIIASGAAGSKNGVNCDGIFKINGGCLLATGGKNTNPSSTSAQNSVIYNGLFNSGEHIHLQTAEGKPVMTYQFPRTYSVLKLTYSASDLTKGNYSLYKGGEVSGGENVHGFVLGGSYTPGTWLMDFSISGTVTKVN